MLDQKAFYAEVGQKVKQARERRGLTQEELSSQVSLTRTSITNIEQGRQKFMLHTLIQMAAALAVAPSSLLPEAIPPPADDLEVELKDLPANKRQWIKKTIEADEYSE
jgi:transcriptional regulator with XRE-family HTH domain